MNVVDWLLMAVLAIAFAYVLVRAASFAFFRTRLEHFRSVLRELRKDDNNNA